MRRNKGQIGRPRPRIVESDSESEDDVNVLSTSMSHVKLQDENIRKTESPINNIRRDSPAKNVRSIRKPPRGKYIQRLEDFSWSSSDDESEGSDSISCWSSERKSLKTIENRSNALTLPLTSLKDDSSYSSVSFKQNPVRTKVKTYTTKTTCSSDLSSSDDDFSLSSATSTDNHSTKKNSWTYHKNRQEYTIGGNGNFPALSIPSDLHDQLYDFQKAGVAWMATLHRMKVGGILGDDMGMGKTYTTLSFLGGLMKAKTIRKAVVIAPVSVLRNWENEARKILGLCVGNKVKIQVLTSQTSVQSRKKKLHEALKAQSLQLVITSYGLVANNPDHFTQYVAGKQVWDYVVLDEAHNIKNPNTKNSQAMERIAGSPKTHRLILTGTPIMNNLKELHALFSFATSGKILGTHKKFQNEFGKPIEAARSADAHDHEVETGNLAIKELQQLIQPYFLQRMKSEYLAEALPPKHEYVLWTNLSALQRDMYEEYIQSEYVFGIVEGEAKSPLFAIAYLQKLCGHPLLVEEEHEDSIENFDEHDQNLLMEKSTKLKVMYNLVHTLITKGHRTLIFSQFTKVLNIIERVLENKFRISRIDGKTKEKDRQRLVDEFNQPDSDVSIMLISTKAGGQGLTLTGADSCIVYDPSWNPAEDAQAVDRCYRLGQKKRVQVFRLISAGTVEEKRYEKQIHKDGIRRTMLTNTGNNTAKYFTKEELRKKVFVLGEEGKCEFLNKLQHRGFSYDEKKNPEHSYSSHEGVIGQSSHDVVYSLPENFYFEETIHSPSQQPFSSPPTETKWLTNKTLEPRLLGRSQSVLSRKIDSFDKENKAGKIKYIGSPPTETKWMTNKTKPRLLGRSQSVLSRKMDNFDKENKAGKSKYIGAKSNDSRPVTSSTLLTKSLSTIKNLKDSAEKEQAMSFLMDLLEKKDATLNDSDKATIHLHMATISNSLGWLEN